MASLLIDVLADNRKRGRFWLHEFVIMPDHIHVLLTPAFEIPLERAVQFIKGGYYAAHRSYIHENPARKGLRADYPYCSARGTYELDPAPPGLKPTILVVGSQG